MQTALRKINGPSGQGFGVLHGVDTRYATRDAERRWKVIDLERAIGGAIKVLLGLAIVYWALVFIRDWPF